MGFPSNIGSRRNDLASAWSWIRQFAGNVRLRAQQLHDASNSGPIGANLVIEFVSVLETAKQELARAMAVPGIVGYVRDQIDNQLFDLVGEHASLEAQINATRGWIVANFPQEPTEGWLLYARFDTSQRIEIRTLTSAQTAPLRAQLLALIATID